ncbi:hypothetical protein TBLA_0A06370 [Henningerozyma blattae CBS 6284]|uniref:RNase III domain-containing protein n=1 Tax=Henningerozyma blattae (strain ATCC 34711 / CBS 6284 / DSM 70876 / NBRC 10599 / NRRL Y-10934 / UCD 77-7) TaxID=1071380 RepID=I2GWC6_HENB6|nr:hypothetical protein TBLA_0A06370 [Tetrapisispora blattae CBS 6284]CCH58428.1 hypothetical protein TBLA_0A06370 [Tetrapisispora blattae CBS 6284]
MIHYRPYYGLLRASVSQLHTFIEPISLPLANVPLKIPSLHPKILERQHAQNIKRIEKFKNTLNLQDYNINISKDDPEIIKCLYPLRYAHINIKQCNNIKKHNKIENEDKPQIITTNSKLCKLGKNLFNLSIKQVFLKVFKKTSTDINGYDFNYFEKVNRKLIKNASLVHELRVFLKSKGLKHIARVSLPRQNIQIKTHIVFDEYVFFSIIGYLILTDNFHSVNKLINEEVSKEIIRTIILKK